MRSHSFYAAALAGAAFILASSAQPVPKLDSISTDWVQRGATAQITLSGENLADAADVLVSGAPGVSARLIAPPESNVTVESSFGGITSVTRHDGKSLKLELSIEAGAALTERELRVSSPDGVSNPLSVRVGHFPEVASAAKTNREEPQEIQLPAAVSGILKNSAESHFFKFAAKKGQPVIFDLHAARNGSRLDSSLVVLDLTGKELVRNEDGAGLDSVVDFNAPEDGEFILELRDFRYQGGNDYKYRLLAGVFPYVESSFPFGGQRGQTVEVQLKGANLNGTSKLLLNLAKDAPINRQEIRASTPLGLSNPFPLHVSDLPYRNETEPNSSLGQADAITFPIAINGRIGAKKDYDAFRFDAAKGQRVIFSVDAYAFGSRLDGLLILTDDGGSVLQRNDDSNAVDARIDYTFKEPGAYYIILEDLLGRGGDDFGYRLSATIPEPSFSVAVLPDTARLRRGGYFPVRCELTRANGFAEPVRITCENLPPGVYAEPLVFSPSGSNAGVLMLTASADAALGSFPINYTASSVNDGRAAREAARPLSGDRTVMQAFLTVLDPAPFSISAGTLFANFEQNDSGSVEVLLERREGFSGQVKVTADAFSSARDGMTKSFGVEPLILKPGQNAGKLTLRAKTDAEVGARPIVLKAEADSGGISVTEYSRPVPLATEQIPFVLSSSLKKLLVTALPENAGSAASEAAFSIKVNRRMNFTGELELKIEGVPEGVTATVANIAANANEAAVKLVASEKAGTGKDHSITITGVGTHQDRIYRFKAPPITLTINAPEKEQEAKIAATK